MSNLSVQFLISSKHHTVAAELTPGRKIEFKESGQWILDEIKLSGINVSEKFRTQHKIDRAVVFPTDDDKVFALAFKEFTFKRGLQQMGYFWVNEEDYWGDIDPRTYTPKLNNSL